MAWLDDQRTLLTRYDEAIAQAMGSASVGVDGRTLVNQRIETLTRLRNELASQIAQAESGGAMATVQVTVR